MSSDPLKDSTDHLNQAFELDGTREHIDALYDEWADSYDRSMRELTYRVPEVVANLVDRLQSSEVISPAHDQLRVLDAACGTGLVGARLAQTLECEVMGFDLNTAMVEKARERNCYEKLWSEVDLNQPLENQISESGFDLAVACGVFTHGHVPPESLQNLIEVVRPGGAVVVSARDAYAEEEGFNAFCEALVSHGRVALLERAHEACIAEDSAHYWALQVAA